MQRFFLSSHPISSGEINFPLDICHQIKTVLRLQAGDQVEVAFGDGWIYLVELQIINEKQVIGEISARSPADSEPTVKIHLLFALTQREKVEWILQKGTEAGVFAFHPYISQRTLIQNDALSDKKRDRWERIIREAAEQSQRGQLPELNPPGKLTDMLVRQNGNIILAAMVGDEPESLKPLLKRIKIEQELDVIIGPEGGFHPDEIQQMQASAVHFFSMGRRILRMETAAIIAPALILYEFGEMGISK